MASVITWLDVSSDEQRRMRELAAMFTQRDSRDELGIGQIRDGISDALFPGTSTLHTRARYLLFIPWCFQHAAQSKSRVKGGKRQPDATELDLIEPLRVSSDPSGLLGERAGADLKNLPSSVYWTMLQRYGILTRPASRADAFDASAPHVHVDDDGMATSASIWSAPAAPKGFPEEVPEGFSLAPEEASWLRDRILEHAPGTLLAHLVHHAPEDDSRAPWQDAAAETAPARAARVLRHAQHFATILHGAQLLYNFLLAEESDHADLREDYRSRLAQWADELAPGYAEWRLEDLLHVLREERGSRLPVAPAAQRFVQSWTALVQQNDPASLPELPEARSMIREREKIKGAKARLGNPRRLETWNGASGSAMLTFRWSTVRQLTTDIHEGLSRA